MTEQVTYPAADFVVEYHGTVSLIIPQNDAAYAWADAHIDARRQHIGQKGIPIEGSFLWWKIISSAVAAGFVCLHAPKPATLTNWCARNAYDHCVGVIYPYLGGFAIANRHYGGYPYVYATVEDAKATVELKNPTIVRWDVVEVPQ